MKQSIQVRLSDDQYRMLSLMAKDQNVSLSDLARSLMFGSDPERIRKIEKRLVLLKRKVDELSDK